MEAENKEFFYWAHDTSTFIMCHTPPTSHNHVPNSTNFSQSCAKLHQLPTIMCLDLTGLNLEGEYCYGSNTMSTPGLQTSSRQTHPIPTTSLTPSLTDSKAEFCPQHITSLPASPTGFPHIGYFHSGLTPNPYCFHSYPTAHATLHTPLVYIMHFILYVSPVQISTKLPHSCLFSLLH